MDTITESLGISLLRTNKLLTSALLGRIKEIRTKRTALGGVEIIVTHRTRFGEQDKVISQIEGRLLGSVQLEIEIRKAVLFCSR